MARILGVEIPDQKRAIIGLSYIYGIGVKTAGVILKKVDSDPNKKIADLTSEEIARILKVINEEYKVEGELRSEKMLAIKRLMDVGCYEGRRHREGRTVRGQRTKNNCRTKKGPKPNAIKKRRQNRKQT